jgi:hypothetical protein
VKNKCEVGYTPFLSLLYPWRLNRLRAGQPGLDSRKGQDVSLLHNVHAGSRGPPSLLSNEYRALFFRGENGRGVKLRYSPNCERMKLLRVGVHSFLITPVSVASRRATGWTGLDSRQGQDVSLLHNVQTGSGAHPASYPMSTGGSFYGG